jgi:hypothetical protein
MPSANQNSAVTLVKLLPALALLTLIVGVIRIPYIFRARAMRCLAARCGIGGENVFWSKGRWFAEWEEAVAVKSHCGFRSGFSQGGCEIDIIKNGASKWWVQVKTKSGVTGWVLAEKLNGDKPWYGNFSDLCHYGED